MKTPRELLLSHHAHAVPRLDALRRAVVAEHVTGPSADATVAATGFLEQLWIELFWSTRRTWAGLAAVWLAILGLHLADREVPSTSATVRTAALGASELRLALMEQVRLRTELLGLETPSVPEPANQSAPGPRSETLARPGAA